jgi:hypothetical protein
LSTLNLSALSMRPAWRDEVVICPMTAFQSAFPRSVLYRSGSKIAWNLRSCPRLPIRLELPDDVQRSHKVDLFPQLASWPTSPGRRPSMMPLKGVRSRAQATPPLRAHARFHRFCRMILALFGFSGQVVISVLATISTGRAPASIHCPGLGS